MFLLLPSDNQLSLLLQSFYLLLPFPVESSFASGLSGPRRTNKVLRNRYSIIDGAMASDSDEAK